MDIGVGFGQQVKIGPVMDFFVLKVRWKEHTEYLGI
jgi:hypothetical protein